LLFDRQFNPDTSEAEADSHAHEIELFAALNQIDPASRAQTNLARMKLVLGTDSGQVFGRTEKLPLSANIDSESKTT